jgi:chromatin structure-remodeling complex protein RSC7
MQEKQGKNYFLSLPTPFTNISSRFNGFLTAARKQNANGLYDIHTNSMQWPLAMQPTHARWDVENDERDDETELSAELAKKWTIFPKLDAVYARNFRIHDVYLETASDSTLGVPGIADDETSLSNIATEIVDELPPECREAFEEAINRETEWKTRWQTETTDGRRAHFLPATAWFP